MIKKDGDDGLICSILPTATTDFNMMCHSNKMDSPCFVEAIKRADFTVSAPQLTAAPGNYRIPVPQKGIIALERC